MELRSGELESGNKSPKLSHTPAQIETMVKNALARRTALSFNLLMYEDGSVSPLSLEGLRQVRKLVRGH